MRRHLSAVLCLTLALGTAGVFGFAQLSSSGATMTAAAGKLVKSFSDDQRAKAIMPYDAAARTDWHYIPKATRKGLPVKEMDDTQRKAAHALLQCALSAAGYGKAAQIMQLETVLAELEKGRAGAPVRDPERYFFTIFGHPDPNGRWGLSVEGHHLSLNFVVDQNRVISSTPTFYGANPGELLADYGPGFPQGLRILIREEELAFQLLDSLSPDQRTVAVVSDKAPSDVRGASQTSPPLSSAEGLAATAMTAAQQAILKSLIEEYAHNLPLDVANERLAAIDKEGLAAIKFCWRGSDSAARGTTIAFRARRSWWNSTIHNPIQPAILPTTSTACGTTWPETSPCRCRSERSDCGCGSRLSTFCPCT